jgi:hypothetical protein
MKDSGFFFKSVWFVGIGLCGACCLLPITVVMFGMGVLTFLTGFLQWVGIISLIGAVVFITSRYLRSGKAHSCNVDCGCKGGKKA